MSKQNGQINEKEIEIIPDYENEIVEEVQSEGCGCNKAKSQEPTANGNPKINYWAIGLVILSVILIYTMVKKGKAIVPTE